MLPVNYGNFLRKSDVKKSSYEIMKPHISKCVNCFVAFSLGTFLVAAGFFVSERFIKSPLVVHDEGLYKEYQSLNSRISKNAALLRESRPEGINAIDALEKIASAKADGIFLSSVEIRPEKYSIKGQCKELAKSDEFLNNLDFGKDKTVTMGNIMQKDGYAEFVVDIKEKPKTRAKAKSKTGGSKK